MGLLGDSDGKESTCNAGDPGSIPGLGRPPGEGNGKALWYSCLGNPMDRGAKWARVFAIKRVRHTRLSNSRFHFIRRFVTIKWDHGQYPTCCKQLIHVNSNYYYNFCYYCVCVYSVAQSCPWDFSGKNTEIGHHFLLQGIFLTQGSNPPLLHWQVDSLPLSHQESP